MHMSEGLPQWKYCPLKQVCITGIIHAVGAYWQKLEKQQIIIATTQTRPRNAAIASPRPRASALFLILGFYYRSSRGVFCQAVGKFGRELPQLHKGDTGKTTLIRLLQRLREKVVGDGGRRGVKRKGRGSPAGVC